MSVGVVAAILWKVCVCCVFIWDKVNTLWLYDDSCVCVCVCVFVCLCMHVCLCVLACIPCMYAYMYLFVPCAYVFLYHAPLRRVGHFCMWPLVTVQNTRQLSCSYLAGVYEVGVHIADVSYFVKEKTKLDEVASSRATSVYLVQKVRKLPPPPKKNTYPQFSILSTQETPKVLHLLIPSFPSVVALGLFFMFVTLTTMWGCSRVCGASESACHWGRFDSLVQLGICPLESTFSAD